MTKIYTKTGDKGETSLLGSERVPKNDLRIHALGTIDEANAAVGMAISLLRKESFHNHDFFLKTLTKIQTDLFKVGLVILQTKPVWDDSQEYIMQLEESIDSLDDELPILTQFILPGGHQASAALHIARTIVRRAERNLLSIEANHPVNSYLNRLSDFLFVAARFVNKQLGVKEDLLGDS